MEHPSRAYVLHASATHEHAAWVEGLKALVADAKGDRKSPKKELKKVSKKALEDPSLYEYGSLFDEPRRDKDRRRDPPKDEYDGRDDRDRDDDRENDDRRRSPNRRDEYGDGDRRRREDRRDDRDRRRRDDRDREGGRDDRRRRSEDAASPRTPPGAAYDEPPAEEEEADFSQLADEMDEILNDPPPEERVREKAPSREAAFDFAPPRPRREERVEEDRPRDRDDDEVRRSGDGAPGKPPPPARSPEERRADVRRERHEEKATAAQKKARDRAEDRVRKSREGAKFRAGDAVDARYRGGAEVYAGVIARVRGDERYDVDYDDGEVEDRAGGDLIALRGGADFAAGARVDVDCRGRSYPGVARCGHADGSYDVDFADGEREKGVEGRRLTAIRAQKPASPERRKERAPESPQFDDEIDLGAEDELMKKARPARHRHPFADDDDDDAGRRRPSRKAKKTPAKNLDDLAPADVNTPPSSQPVLAVPGSAAPEAPTKKKALPAAKIARRGAGGDELDVDWGGGAAKKKGGKPKSALAKRLEQGGGRRPSKRRSKAEAARQAADSDDDENLEDAVAAERERLNRKKAMADARREATTEAKSRVAAKEKKAKAPPKASPPPVAPIFGGVRPDSGFVDDDWDESLDATSPKKPAMPSTIGGFGGVKPDNDFLDDWDPE